MSPIDPAQFVRSFFEESAKAQRASGAALADALVATARCISDCYAHGGTLFAFGNGGSASQAQHLVAELVGRYQRERRPLAAVALGADSPTLTCIGNDFAFEEIFARPMQALGKPGDLAFGISTSGRSPNVIRALEVAKELGLRTVAMIGANDGPLPGLVEIALPVPATATSRIQECHTTAIHALTELVEALVLGTALSPPG
jgi:D-sedoheptulose 7-phosphate isomerase